jgi:(1->4)-alpha-D-glucan 1-alpha-D-glucosylmutase
LHGIRLVRATRQPLATYRLQFNRRFTFAQAVAVVEYLRTLGIGDCYASSYLAAVPGSPHGYDVADPTRLNPDLGSDADYWRWVEELRSHGMGHVLDLVPNHMGIAKSANTWWLDVLENGPSSRFARVFDIEWRPVKDELADKLLIPILGDQYGAALERQELALVYEHGAFALHYYDERLPIAPDTYGMILAPALGEWLADHPGEAADELQSILNASEHLPSRSSRDADSIAIRAREKEVVKRRLAAVTERSAAVGDYVDAAVARFNGTRGQPRSFDLLDGLLNAQSYRLAHWRVASEEINYRRFFDVNQLAAVRMEDPCVFEDVHRFVFELIGRGGPTGLRVDHVDGLFAPRDYLHRLQSTIARTRLSQNPENPANPANPANPTNLEHPANPPNPANPFYIIVEKILGADETMPCDWPVAGTTGYEFAAVLNNLFVDRRNERALDDVYRRFVRERQSFGDLAYRSKKQVLHETMSGDINSLGHQLNRFSEGNRHFRDFTLYSLISTLKDVIACFPVYRTYITSSGPISERDSRYVREAVRCAKRRAPGIASVVFDFVERLLLRETAVTAPGECEARARFIGKFQQLTSPVAAKGIEDTALYVYNRLLSLNEVGSDPTRFGMEPGAVHEWMSDRLRRWPGALSATATHDAKRGEDVRARLNVLSEIPGAWKAAVSKWRALNRRFKADVRGVPAPDPNEEYFLYQTLVGIWPFEEAAAATRDRVRAYMTKALREAKVHTSWLSPDEAYEDAVSAFVDAILDRRRAAPFLHAFEAFEGRVAELGIYNSLAQLLIKVTAPGVPDFYQGTELWDLSLVDPDNRRPVDYGLRNVILRGLAEPAAGAAAAARADELLRRRTDGRVKMLVTERALHTRALLREVFEEGAYVPLSPVGARHDCLFAFSRQHRGDVAITCVPRLIASLIPDVASPPVGSAVWGDTRVELPVPDRAAYERPFRDVFTGIRIEPETVDGRLTMLASRLFESFPVALLVACPR